MSERSETESERDLDGIDVISEPDASSKRSSLRSGAGGVIDRNDSSPAPHQVGGHYSYEHPHFARNILVKQNYECEVAKFAGYAPCTSPAPVQADNLHW